ncbi:YegS/Rv2252/BmrU family lipid kinase [bacterium AH-315-C07]|nr:YegS/Rv2252/BmrU family lipid kinase [bacterium AH-315-C07]
MKRSLYFIVNPKSGASGSRVNMEELIHNCLSRNDVKYELVKTEYAGHAIDLAKKALDEGADTIVAVGGDGTIHEVGSTLVNKEATLGIVPCGSGNGFARHLGIPLDPIKAIQTAATGNSKLVDTININDEICLNVGGVGFDAHIAKCFEESKGRGLTNYIRLIVREWFKFQNFSIKLSHNDCLLESQAFMICIANTDQFGNNAFISPLSNVADGKIEIVVIKKPSLFHLPILIYKLFNKVLSKSSIYNVVQTEEAILNLEVETPVHLDGEIASPAKTLKIRVNSGSLKVMTP